MVGLFLVCFGFFLLWFNLFSLLQNAWERIFESLLLFLFNGMDHYYLPRNGSERNSGSFLFRGTAGILSELTNCSVYSIEIDTIE
jgi:hypothetical protein